VSSILDALRALEAGTEAVEREPRGRIDRSLPAWKAAALLAFSVAMGTGGAVFLVAGSAVERAEPVATSATLPLAAPAPPLPTSLSLSDPPRARVMTASTAASATQRRPAADPPRPSDEPSVHVRSLRYSPLPAERAVELAVADARPVTLREGQSVGGVQVQLITPEGVYVRHGGQIFAVRALPPPP